MADETKNQEDELNSDGKKFNFAEFKRAMGASDILNAMGFYNNPFWRNDILKELTQTPAKYSRDNVIKLLEDPVYNEKALKDVAQYLMNTSNHFKRLVNHMATILDFRYILLCLNPDDSSAYQKNNGKALDWLNKFNLKYEFGKIMKTVILEDTGFYYLRESKSRITLQRMPTDYCMIVDQTDLGYQYAFNMTYFMRPGVTLDAFAPEFQDFYDEFISGDKTVPFYWMDLPPEKAFVFKWDENFAGIIPVLIGLYLDTLQLMEYKDLLMSKTALENWKILFQKIPMKSGDNAEKNDFLIDPDTAGEFQKIIKQSLPQGASIITSPMEISSVNFENAETKDDIVGNAQSIFWDGSGSSPLLFGGAIDSSAGLSSSIITDENFVLHMYEQFSRFVNFQLSKVTGKHNFIIDFMDSTRFNRKEQFDEAMTMAQSGMPLMLVAHAKGLKPSYLDAMLKMEDASKIKDILNPLPSSHTLSGDTGGRPQKNEGDLSASGIKTKDNEANKNRN